MGEMNKGQFSPSSLQDLVDCRRRYFYRSRLRLSWPAEQAAPMEDFEQQTRLGEQFHRLVQQYFSGVEKSALAQSASQDLKLAGWWERFLKLGLPRAGRQYLPEQMLVWQGSDHRLAAKYDLIEVDPEGKVTIFDWKTTMRPASKAQLAVRMQTKVYPLLLSRAGDVLTSGELIAPEQITMVYWFSEQPDAPVEFVYSSSQQEQDEAVIGGLIEEVIKLDEIDEFPLTEDLRQCKYCEYRSLCDRGVRAGGMDELPDLALDQGLDLEIDLEGIEEIEF
jgi:RecB family exonuclease